MLEKLHHDDASWDDVPRLLALLVSEVQKLNQATDRANKKMHASMVAGSRGRA